MSARDRHRWSRYRALVLPELWERQGGVCAVCHYPVDMGGDGRRPDGPSVDHIDPLHDGADVIPEDSTGVRLVHKRCNTARGNRTRVYARLADQRRANARTIEPLAATDDRAEEKTEILIDGRVFSESSLTPPKASLENPRNTPGIIGIGGEVLRLPRMFTDRPDDVTGSYGGLACEWAARVLRVELRPWQRWALDRALEHRADGSLRWRTVVLSVSRQSGKSVTGRAVCGWRQNGGPAVFGEPQTVVSTANKFQTALELWQGAAYAMQAVCHSRVRWARGAEEIGDPNGSRWLVQAATPNLGVGLSVSMALVDEAWNVERDHVEASLVPTMLERESPQLWIVSTQGDSSSDLLEGYRRQGVKGIADPNAADVLLLEWSADPSAAVTDRDAWRQASPHWSDRREAFIASQLDQLGEDTFRTQILNQRVDALGGWVTRSQWEACQSPLDLQAGPAAPKIIAACEYSEDGSLYALVVTQRIGDRIVARTYGERKIDEL